MDLREYYRKIRRIEAEINETFVVIVEPGDSGRRQGGGAERSSAAAGGAADCGGKGGPGDGGRSRAVSSRGGDTLENGERAKEGIGNSWLY